MIKKRIPRPVQIMILILLLVSLLSIVSFLKHDREERIEYVYDGFKSENKSFLLPSNDDQRMLEGEYVWRYDFKKVYSSKGAQITFAYPDKFTITEKNYIFPEYISPANLNKIDIFEGDEQILSIISYDEEYFEKGGGLIPETDSKKIYQLPDKKYLFAVQYCDDCKMKFLNANVPVYNSVGEKFYSHDHDNHQNGRQYEIMTTGNLTTEHRKLIEGIVSSIQYDSSDDTSNEIMGIRINSEQYTIPGTMVKVPLPLSILENDPVDDGIQVLSFKHPDFEAYNSMNIAFTISENETISEPDSFYYSGGYDAAKRKCILNGEYVDMKSIGNNLYCEAGGGDAGEGSSIIHVVNFENNKILSIRKEFNFGPEYLFTLDPLNIAKNIIWE